MTSRPMGSGGGARPVSRETALERETRRQLREAVVALLTVADPEDLSPLAAQIEEAAPTGPGPEEAPVPDEPVPGRELFDDTELAHRLGPELSLSALAAWGEAEGYEGPDVLECAVRQAFEAVARCGEAIGPATTATPGWATGLSARARSFGHPDPEALAALVAFFAGGEGPACPSTDLLEACATLTAAAVDEAARQRRALPVDLLAWAFPEAAADHTSAARQLLRLGLAQPSRRPLVPLPGVARVRAWRPIDRDESWQRFPDAPAQLRGRAMTAVVVDPVPPLLHPEVLAADRRPRLPTASVGVITYDNGDGSANAYVCVVVWDSFGSQAPGDDRLLLVLDPGDDRGVLASLVQEGVLSLSPPALPDGPPVPAMVVPLPPGAVAEAVLVAADGMAVAPAA